LVGGGVAALGALVAGGVAAGVGIGGFGWLIARSATSIVRGDPESVVAKIRTESHGVVHVRRRHLAETSLAVADDGSLAIDLRFKGPQRARFVGPEAHRIASIIVPKANRFGGNQKAIGEAVREIESLGNSERYLAHLAKVSRKLAPPLEQSRRRFGSARWGRELTGRGLSGLPSSHRLALEMALHEEAERRAMQGELEELERAWRDAEEIAAISDNLLVPASIDEAMKRLKRS
jgi:hypothetical protein